MFVLRLNILILFSNIVIYLLVPMDLVFCFMISSYIFSILSHVYISSQVFPSFSFTREMYFITFNVNTLKYSPIYIFFFFSVRIYAGCFYSLLFLTFPLNNEVIRLFPSSGFYCFQKKKTFREQRGAKIIPFGKIKFCIFDVCLQKGGAHITQPSTKLINTERL